MGVVEFLTTSLGAIIILGYFSFIFYKENPWSRWAEYSLVGLGVAYGAVITTWRAVDYVLGSIGEGDFSIIVPVILGLLVYSQFTKKYRWLMRWPLAIITSVGLTVSLTGVPLTMFLAQFKAVAVPLTTTRSVFDAVNAIIILVGVVTILSYFTFTHEHKGALGISAKIGRLIMMLALGGAFGMSILSQGTFLITVIRFLLRDWLGVI